MRRQIHGEVRSTSKFDFRVKRVRRRVTQNKEGSAHPKPFALELSAESRMILIAGIYLPPLLTYAKERDWGRAKSQRNDEIHVL